MRRALRALIAGAVVVNIACSSEVTEYTVAQQASVVVPLPIEVIDLGYLGDYKGAVSYRISDEGHVVGWSDFNGLSRPFLWRGGVMVNLGTLGGRSGGEARDVNVRGQVVGESENAAGEDHAFLWSNGIMTDLGTLGGRQSGARGINRAGHIAGMSETSDGEYHAVLWRDGVMIDLGTLGGTDSYAADINDAGQIVGASQTIGDTSIHAFLWENGVMTDLGTLGGAHTWRSEATAINENGWVVGYSADINRRSRAVLWRDGKVIDIGASLIGTGWPEDINAAGHIVGNDQAGAYLLRDGVRIDLATLRGGSSNAANGINRSGLIVGWSNTRDIDNASHAVMWRNRRVPR